MANSSGNKTGSYAVTTTYTTPWNKMVKNTTQAKPRRKTGNIMIYPIFEECANLIEDDPYWVKIFMEASRDKFPRGFSYRDNNLIYRKGQKTFKNYIPDNTVDALQAALTFFRDKGCMLSEKDRLENKKKTAEQISLQDTIETCNWKDFKREKVRAIFISDYIQELVGNLSLDVEQKKELETTIRLGFLFKSFTNDNVVFEKGKIRKIIGLTIDDATKTFSIDKNLPRARLRSIKPIGGLGINPDNPKGTSFINNWQKFLESLQRNHVSTNKAKFKVVGDDQFNVIIPDELDDDSDDDLSYTSYTSSRTNNMTS